MPLMTYWESVDLGRDRALEGLQGADDGGEFHAVVGGFGFAAPIPFLAAQAQDGAPAPGARDCRGRRRRCR